MPGTFQTIMYNQPENEPKFTTVYAVVDISDSLPEVPCLYTFSEEKAKKKLEELRKNWYHPKIKYEIREIQVER